MANVAAYGAALQIGTAQVETAVVVVTTVTAGNATVTTTDAILAGSPLDTVVALANNDIASTVARKFAVAMNLVSALTDVFTIVAHGDDLVLTRILAAANDGTLNIAYADTTSAGLTDDATSNNTTAGAALATVAQVTNIGGPSLSADTIDVTTHDSTNAWEETKVGVLRSGEVPLDIVYDPAEDTHDGTAGNGLLTRIKNKVRTDFSLIFPDTGSTTWGFNGEISGFVPSAPIAAGLTATITIKITGEPTLV